MLLAVLLFLLLLAHLHCSECKLIFTELHFAADKQDECEFVELFNTSPNETVALGNIELDDAIEFKFPANATLAPLNYLVVTENTVKFMMKFSISTTATWVYGPYSSALSSEHESIELKVDGDVDSQLNYKYGFPWPAPVRPLESIQLINTDAKPRTAGSMWRAAVPTPGAACNSTIAVSSLASLPPFVDEAIHLTNTSTQTAVVAITVRHTAAVVVTFRFQHVAPGAYIRRSDASFQTQWTDVMGNDNGVDGDRIAKDGIFSARCPAGMLVPRSIIRWRVKVDYGQGSFTVPTATDVPNFAFYWYYPTLPAYRAAINPSDATQATLSTIELASAEPMPVMHVIANEQDVWDGQYMYKTKLTYEPSREGYNYTATLVIDDEVYDHVRWRCRGALGRFAYGKNAWKFQFNDGWYARLRQDGPKLRAVPGRRLETLNVDSLFLNLVSGYRRQYEPIGTHGLPQMMTARMFELGQVPSLWQSLLHFRIVIYANESTTDQYKGDFWGLYLGYEEADSRYLGRHDMPDGSLYKVERPPEPSTVKVQGKGHEDNTNFVLGLLATLSVIQSDQWGFDNIDMPLYYRWRAVSTVVGHLGIGRGKNWMVFRPSAGDLRLKVLPWDFDRTYLNAYVNDDRVNQTLQTPRGQKELHAQMASFVQLYCNNSDEAYRMLDEQARRVWDDSRAHHIADAERRRWDFSPDLDRSPYQAHPFQVAPNGTGLPAPKGQFYVRANIIPGFPGQQVNASFAEVVNIVRDQTTLFTGDFKTMITRYLRRVVQYQCANLAQVYLQLNTAASTTPGPAPTAVDGLNVDRLRFSTTAPALGTTRLEWQIAARSGANVTGSPYVPGDKFRFEIAPLYTASAPTSDPQEFIVPIDYSLIGYSLRVRSRVVSSDGSSGLWSLPFEFTAAAPMDKTPPLVVSELMYHARDSSAHDYLELHNAGSVERRLNGIEIDGGIKFKFGPGDTIAPRTSLVLASDPAAFMTKYGVTPFNMGRPYNGSLSNSGETIEIKDASGGVMERVSYDSRIPSISALADGAGFSLERVNTAGAVLGARPQWRLSPLNGTPGTHADGNVTLVTLVVNEVMAAPLDGQNDWVELYNAGITAINLEAEKWYITDDFRRPTRARLTGTIEPRAFKFVSRRELGFGFSTDGDECYVMRVGDDGQPTGQIHGFEFDASPRGMSIGRFVTFDGVEHLGIILSRPTPGFENAYPAPSSLAVTTFAIDLTEQRVDNGMVMTRDIRQNRPTRTAYVEMQVNSAPLDAVSPNTTDVLMSGATPTGSERWCVRGCRYNFCFDGERRGARAILSEARTLWFSSTLSLDGVVLGGPAVEDGEGLADRDNANVWTGAAIDPCTMGGVDTRVRVERRRVDSSVTSPYGDELVEVRERIDFAALAAYGVAANVSLEERGPVRFVRQSGAIFAGDIRGWKAAPFEAANNAVWPKCSGSDLTQCVSVSPCVVATGCSASGECIFEPKVCGAPVANCSVTFCSEETQGCAERKIDFVTAGSISIGLSPLCSVDPAASSKCGNGVIEPGEVCDGELCCDATCKMFKLSGAICRAAPSGASCTQSSTCDGTTAVCPAAKIAAAGTECRPANASLACDVAEKCDGTSSFCPDDGSAPFMSMCTPKVALDMCHGDPRCTNQGVCNALFTCDCTAMPTQCDTGDACWRGTCENGACKRTVASAGTTCNDGNVCTIRDVCSEAGVCAGETGICVDSCSGHGRCCAGQCQCEPGWTGLSCATVDDMMAATLPPDSVNNTPEPDAILAFLQQEWVLYAGIAIGACLIISCILIIICICVVCKRKKQRNEKRDRKMMRESSVHLYDYKSAVHDPVMTQSSNFHTQSSNSFERNPFGTVELTKTKSQMHIQQPQQRAPVAQSDRSLQESIRPPPLVESERQDSYQALPAQPSQFGTQSFQSATVPSVFSGVAEPSYLPSSATVDDEFGDLPDDLPEVNLDRESQAEQFY